MAFERHTYSVENPSAIQSIVLVDADVRVEVLSSGDGSMHAAYYESEKEKYGITLCGDTLSIKKRTPLIGGFFSFHFAPDGGALTMYLSEGYDGDLFVTTSDGDIVIDGVTLSMLTAKTADGDIALHRTHISNCAALKTLDGDIEMGRITAPEVSLHTTDGDITLGRPLISDRLSLKTMDGDIDGLLAGRRSDYSLSVRTLDGDSNLASGGSGKTHCKLMTVDGDIDVSFEDGDSFEDGN